MGRDRGSPSFRRLGVLASALVLFVVVNDGRAHAGPNEKKNLDVLYAEARTAFDAGKYDKACPLFAEYFEREPIPAALFTLAECEARWGKPALALEHFEDFVRRSGGDAAPSPVVEHRLRIAKEHIGKLSTQVGRVLPRVSPGVHGSVLVKLDGTPVAMPAERPMVVEPGEHTIELATEAGTHEQRRFIVGAGELRDVEIGAAPAPTPAPSPTPDARPPRPRHLSAPVLVAGGVGVAGLAVAGIVGAIAWANVGDVDAHCEGQICDATGKRAADRVKGLGTASDVAFAIGLAGVAVAVVLHLLEPRPSLRGGGTTF